MTVVTVHRQPSLPGPEARLEHEDILEAFDSTLVDYEKFHALLSLPAEPQTDRTRRTIRGQDKQVAAHLPTITNMPNSPKDSLAWAVRPPLHRLCNLELLKMLQLIQQMDLVQELDPVVHALLPSRHHDFAECITVEEPHLAGRTGSDSGCARFSVEECELPKRAAGGVLKHLDRFPSRWPATSKRMRQRLSLGVLGCRFGSRFEHVALALVENVEVVPIGALLDDVLARGGALGL